MVFIPTVTPAQVERPSPKARELNQLLSHAVREYRSRNPDLSPEEVRQALELTRKEVSSSPGLNAIPLLLGFLTLTAGLGLFLWVESGRTGSFPDLPYALVGVVCGLLIVGLGGFVLARSRRP